MHRGGKEIILSEILCSLHSWTYFKVESNTDVNGNKGISSYVIGISFRFILRFISALLSSFSIRFILCFVSTLLSNFSIFFSLVVFIIGISFLFTLPLISDQWLQVTLIATIIPCQRFHMLTLLHHVLNYPKHVWQMFGKAWVLSASAKPSPWTSQVELHQPVAAMDPSHDRSSSFS